MQPICLDMVTPSSVCRGMSVPGKSNERLREAEAVYAELKRVLTHVKALLSGVEDVIQQNRPEGERRKHRIH